MKIDVVLLQGMIVPTKKTLEDKISYRIKRSSATVFLRQDFKDIGGYDQVGRILRQLVQKGLLINIGYGVYARIKRSSITGNMIPEKPLSDLAEEALNKLGVKTVLTEAERLYNEGKSTQVPTGRVLGVQGRVSRKFSYNGRSVIYERYP